MVIIRKRPLASDGNVLPSWLYRTFLGAWIAWFVLFLAYIFWFYPPAM
jgi:hypothetical protein